MILHSFTKYGIPSRNFVFSHKPFAFSSLTSPEKTLRSFEKHLHSLTKLLRYPKFCEWMRSFFGKCISFVSEHKIAQGNPIILWENANKFKYKFFSHLNFPPSPCFFSGSIWGWVNNDRIFIFEWTIPFIWLAQSEEHRSAPVCSDHPQNSLSHFSHISPDKVMMFRVTPLTVHLDSYGFLRGGSLNEALGSLED